MTTVTTTPWWKKRQVIGLATIVLVAGAIAAGVLGSRAKTQHNHSEPEAIKVQVGLSVLWGCVGVSVICPISVSKQGGAFI